MPSTPLHGCAGLTIDICHLVQNLLPMPSLPELTWATQKETVGAQTVMVSHCLEYGICVQGKTTTEVTERTVRKIKSHILLSKHLGKEPFTWLRPSYLEQARHVPTTSLAAYRKEKNNQARRG